MLYLVGLPAGSGPVFLGESDRRRYALTPAVLAELPEEAVVLSPMPVIDEIDPQARSDPRVRIFEQSDLGVPLRMALVTDLLDRAAEP